MGKPMTAPTPLTAAEEANLRRAADLGMTSPWWSDVDIRRLLATLDAARATDAELREAAAAVVQELEAGRFSTLLLSCLPRLRAALEKDR
jgi:hypothetical protein